MLAEERSRSDLFTRTKQLLAVREEFLQADSVVFRHYAKLVSNSNETLSKFISIKFITTVLVLESKTVHV